MKVRKIDTHPFAPYQHWCAGCRCLHPIYVDAPSLSGQQWWYNHNAESPSFDPMVTHRIKSNLYCQYRIKQGQIHYTSTSYHTLAKLKLDLIDLPQSLYLFL